MARPKRTSPSAWTKRFWIAAWRRFAKKKRLSRDTLIARGLRALLAAEGE